MSEDIIRNALTATEDGFLKLVSRTFRFKPIIAAIGSCCLVGVIWQGTVYIANLGDSRAVIGCLNRSNKIVAEQLTKEHNACMEEVREELISSHPDESSILLMKQGVWRIKGIIQCPRQPDGSVLCGYYICRYMLELVKGRYINITPNFMLNAPKTYTVEQIDEVRNIWAEFTLNFKPKSNGG